MQLSPEEELEVRSCRAAIETEERKKELKKKEKELMEKEDKLVQKATEIRKPPQKPSGWLPSYN